MVETFGRRLSQDNGTEREEQPLAAEEQMLGERSVGKCDRMV